MRQLQFENAGGMQPRYASAAKNAATTMFRSYAESAPVGLAVVEAADGMLLYANASFMKCIEVHELQTGSRLIDLAVAAHARRFVLERLDALVHRVHTRGDACHELEILETQPGDEAAWSVSLWPLEASAEVPLIAIMLRETTEQVLQQRARVALVQQLRDVNEQLLMATLREEELRADAEAASEAKSVFVATMSHELRTPLAAIIGYGELLREGLTGPVTDAQKSQLTRILSSANHLLAIINDILSLSSADAANAASKQEDIEVHALVESTNTLVQPLMQGRDVQFNVDIQDEPITICTDPLKLRQILVNLVGNAAKFTEHGTITLAVQRVDSAIEFRVCDTGIGIAAKDIDRIFDAFWQVRDTPTTRRFGGSGLGLNVSRKLAQSMHGDITVESTPGSGSTFRLTLPLTPQ